MSEKLSVVIANWEQASDTIVCIYSVMNSTVKDIDLISEDNGSLEGSAEILSERFP